MMGSVSAVRWHAIAMLAAFVWGAWSGHDAALHAVAAGSFAIAIARAHGRWTPQGRFGVANAITGVRAALAFAVGLLPLHASVPAAGIAIAIFFTLDGVDGWAAKRFSEVSEFGAAFDTEVDAFMVAVALLTATRLGLLGPWILGVAALRWVFVVFASTRVGRPEPARRSGRWAFSLLMCGLSGALIVPRAWTIAVLALGCVAVIGSFMRSFHWSLTTR